MLSMSNQKCLMEPIGVDVTGTTPGLDGAETDTSKQHFMVVAELVLILEIVLNVKCMFNYVEKRLQRTVLLAKKCVSITRKGMSLGCPIVHPMVVSSNSIVSKLFIVVQPLQMMAEHCKKSCNKC